MNKQIKALHEKYVKKAAAERVLLLRYNGGLGTASKMANYTEGRLGVYEEIIADLERVAPVLRVNIVPLDIIAALVRSAPPVVGEVPLLLRCALVVSIVWAATRWLVIATLLQ